MCGVVHSGILKHFLILVFLHHGTTFDSNKLQSACDPPVEKVGLSRPHFFTKFIFSLEHSARVETRRVHPSIQVQLSAGRLTQQPHNNATAGETDFDDVIETG